MIPVQIKPAEPWPHADNASGTYIPAVKHAPDAADAVTVRVPAVSLHPEDVPTLTVLTALAWSLVSLLATALVAVVIWNWMHPVVGP